MAKVQTEFNAFNAAIKLRRFDENKTLREKRDIIREKLEERLPGVFEAHGEVCPSFEFLDQGSYRMGTGIKPLDDDFDIDQGLYFKVGTTDYPDPVVLKERVHEALDGHTKDVRIRRSCVTVFYQREGELIYHVDVAVYVDGSEEDDGKSRLAKGRLNSADKYRFWEISNPQELADTILKYYSSENDRQQFRRVVRYLKRWSDERFKYGGNSAPTGIALTIAVLDNLVPKYGDAFLGTPDDLAASRALVRVILGRFTPHWNSEEQAFMDRLSVLLPIEPWNDLFAGMTDRQMATFKQKLESLRDAMDYAETAVDPVDACERLQSEFGKDFPVPDPVDTAKKHDAPAIVSSSESA